MAFGERGLELTEELKAAIVVGVCKRSLLHELAIDSERTEGEFVEVRHSTIVHGARGPRNGQVRSSLKTDEDSRFRYYRRMTTRTVKYAYRAEPTASQRRWLAGAFGAVRVVYNDYLWQRERIYKGEQAELIPLDKFGRLPADKAWMRSYPQKMAEQARRQAEAAYKNFFTGLSGQRANRIGKPRFKSRRSGGSLTWNGGSLQVRQLSRRWAAVRLPKEGSWLRFRLSRKLPSAPTGVTLKLSPAGEYTVSFTVREEIAEPKTSGPTAGVDMGLIDLAAVVQDDGLRYKIAAPKSYRRAERKLARLHREHSRKTRGSANREKARLRLAKQHGRVAAQRLDQARQIAAKLTSENQVVSLEALNLKGLTRTGLAKSFADAGLGQLAACVEQAAQKRGTRFERVDPAYTSQACAVCGAIDGPKPLAVREWRCPCGAELDRDYNAALNILLLAGGHSESLNGPGGRVRREALAKPESAAMPTEGATSYVAHQPRRRRTRAKSLARRAQLKAHALA